MPPALRSNVRIILHLGPGVFAKLTNAIMKYIASDFVFDHSDLNLEDGLPAALQFHLLMKKHHASATLYNDVVKS